MSNPNTNNRVRFSNEALLNSISCLIARVVTSRKQIMIGRHFPLVVNNLQVFI